MQIGYLDSYGNKVYYASYYDYEDIADDYEPEQEPKSGEQFTGAEWNRKQQRKYYKNLRENLNNSNNPEYTRPPHLADDIQFTPLHHHSPNTSKWVASKISQFQNTVRENTQRIRGGVNNQFAKLQQEQQQLMQKRGLQYRNPITEVLGMAMNMQRVGYWVISINGIKYIGDNENVDSIPNIHPYRILEIGTTYISNKGTQIVLKENGVYTENGIEHGKYIHPFFLQPPAPKEPTTVGIKNEGIISFSQMKKIFLPFGADMGVLESVTKYINKYGKEFGLDDPIILAHFLAQAGYETGYFKTYNSTENLNYSVKNIQTNFSKYFSNSSGRKMSDYTYNPEKLANLVYSDRMGNGLESTGDGWKYRGRGLLQLTGKGEANVKGKGYLQFTKFYNDRFGTKLDFISNPDLVSNNIEIAVVSGLWYFKENVNYSKLTKDPNSVKFTTIRVKTIEDTWDKRRNIFLIILKNLK